MRRKRPAYAVALCGVLAAVAVAVMALGTVIPVGTFCCPALAGLLLVPVLDLFGAGFALAGLRGSESNDAFRIQDGSVVTKTNRCGGILGGITNGMPLLFRTAIKPTPSISRPQESVSLSKMENRTLEVKGRHDPCIVPRAVPVVEAAASIALCDLLIGEGLLHRQEK